MVKVKIYGAGSIGNHLAHACRSKGWDVVMCDPDTGALKRTQESIYPSRYGSWDSGIRLETPDTNPDENFDMVIIGTPPDTHMGLAAGILEKNPPKVLFIEKPLCTPSFHGVRRVLDLQKQTGCFIAVGYNHTLTENSRRVAEIMKQNPVGDTVSLSARFREHWGGIFSAHPWLSGPEDSYLGFFERGGGASGEHSHAINIWQHFAHLTGAGRIIEVSSTMDIVSTEKLKYDRICLVNVRTEKGLVGDIAQDVITQPAQKSVRIQGTDGFVEWIVNFDSSHDAVRFWDGKSDIKTETIQKKRPDDFKGEIGHLEDILNGRDVSGSPISIGRGLDTMLVVAAAHISHNHRRSVRINYDKGYSPESIEIL